MSTRARRSGGHGRLWLVAILVAMMSSLHCVSGHGGTGAPHHQATHAALPGHGPSATHAHLDNSIHQLTCQTLDGMVAVARGLNPLRVLIVLAALMLATLVFQLVAAHLSRGPPLPTDCYRARTGRDILTTLCVIRR